MDQEKENAGAGTEIVSGPGTEIVPGVEEPQQTNWKKEFWSWVRAIAVALVIAFVISQFVIVNAEVPTGSMENTIHIQDRIMAFRLSYLFSEPQRGDIVVFKFPDDESQNYVKRIIGLPGETVEIKSGRVYIDNATEPLPDEYVKGTPIGNFGPYKVPQDCYFMMGDNREISLDARYWKNQYVHKNKILGKVMFKYYPGFAWLG